MSHSKRVLEPNERTSEIFSGLIMVLTFTGSLSIAGASRDDVRVMLIGALGCNLVWKIIDGIFYLMGSLADKGSSIATMHAIRQAPNPQKAHWIIAAAVPSSLASVLEPADLEMLRKRVVELHEPPPTARLGAADWKAAVAVFPLSSSPRFRSQSRSW